MSWQTPRKKSPSANEKMDNEMLAVAEFITDKILRENKKMLKL